MSDQFSRYQEAKARLLDVLHIVDEMRPKAPPHPVSETWGTSRDSSSIHMKLIPPYRPGEFTFMMAHMEKGTVRTTSIPETIVLQCLAGRFRVTDSKGNSQIVVAHTSIVIEANEIYCYEAIEEVYNIMKVDDQKDPHFLPI